LKTVALPTNSAPHTKLPEFTREQIRDYLSDLEAVLRRVDSATTYYQILGVHRTDDKETLRSSYERLLDVLYPTDAITSAVPAEVASRVERAFAKISQAFGVLASFTRRKEYDSALRSVAHKPARQATAKAQHAPPKPVRSNSTNSASQASHQHAQRSGSAATPVADGPGVHSGIERGQVFSESSKASSDNNRRRCGRMKLAMPVRVAGYDQLNGKWSEMGETIDVSRTGARLSLRKRVRQGTVLYLTLPLPTKMRAHGFSEQGYNVYALVRTVDLLRRGMRAVGVEFLGEHPPIGFLEKPWAIYRAKRAGNVERRRYRREDRNEAVSLEYLDENGQSIGRDEVRSENLGSYGVRVVGTTAPAEFDSISVRFPTFKLEAVAVLRDRFHGKDGLERLCLHFVDKHWPER
jgi:curved DNA-binding protein CbpA